MANFESDLRAHLISNPAEGALHDLYALISERIHPLRIEQNSPLPAIAYQIDAKLPYQTQEGSADLYQRTIRLDFVGRTYGEIIAVCDALVGALHNFQGPMKDTTVELITYENSEQGFDEEAEVFFMTAVFNAIYKP